MTVLELNWSKLVKVWRFCSSPVAVRSGRRSLAADAADRDEFTVVLASAGAEKIMVIKVVREITGLGLKKPRNS